MENVYMSWAKRNIAPIICSTGWGNSLNRDGDKNKHGVHLGKVTCRRSLKNMKNMGNKAGIMDEKLNIMLTMQGHLLF